MLIIVEIMTVDGGQETKDERGHMYSNKCKLILSGVCVCVCSCGVWRVACGVKRVDVCVSKVKLCTT